VNQWDYLELVPKSAVFGAARFGLFIGTSRQGGILLTAAGTMQLSPDPACRA
jgi:hypothetical protein